PLSKKDELLLPENFGFSDVAFNNSINFLYLGIKFSDYIVAVSPSYAEEILEERYGCGLHNILREKRNVLKGILNGIDYEEWNPEKDLFIYKNYNFSDLTGKEECKKKLLEEHNLKYDPSIPLIGAVGRLTSQKGWDIISEAIEDILNLGIYFILLGVGEKRYHEIFTDIAKRYPDKTGINIKFDNILAHKIYAGSDFFLMPSYFEPCGLGQLISFRYGTIPIVNPTGGLRDTVNEERGLLLSFYSKDALIDAIKKAKEIFEDETKFNEMRKRVMELDFSLEKQAREYKKFYEEIKSL
ncbi:MAG: hypothetical protein DRI36_03230, partial [Caldiserica bacterium]